MAHMLVSRRRVSTGMLALILLMLISFLLSACNGDPQIQQKASQNKANLDHLLTHAQSISVPYDLLTPIMIQEQQLSSNNAPLTIFSDQPATNYYTNLAQRYQTLAVQLQGLDTQITQQLDYQTSLDLQSFEN